MYKELIKDLNPKEIELVVVSKTQSKDKILEIYNKGQRIFGENRVQELVEKHTALPKDILWHFIGGLQKNKVKYIAPFVDLIHSVDSYQLAKKIDEEAKKNHRSISILLQLKIATETSKQGIAVGDMLELSQRIKQELSSVRICGLMGMASFSSDQEMVVKEFELLKEQFDILQSHMDKSFTIKSMGMSGDYKLAMLAGSNMLRIGSLLFGKRD